MTQLTDAELLVQHFEEEQAAWAEMEAARKVGFAWMRANNYMYPPEAISQRLVDAHAAWNQVRSRSPFNQ